MTGFELLLASLLLGAIVELGYFGYVLFQRRYWRKKLRVERLSSQFGACRGELMKLMVLGDLDSKSATFKGFYLTVTSLMRRPDQYAQISRSLLKSYLGKQAVSELPQRHPPGVRP